MTRAIEKRDRDSLGLRASLWDSMGLRRREGTARRASCKPWQMKRVADDSVKRYLCTAPGCDKVYTEVAQRTRRQLHGGKLHGGCTAYTEDAQRTRRQVARRKVARRQIARRKIARRKFARRKFARRLHSVHGGCTAYTKVADRRYVHCNIYNSTVYS